MLGSSDMVQQPERPSRETMGWLLQSRLAATASNGSAYEMAPQGSMSETRV